MCVLPPLVICHSSDARTVLSFQDDDPNGQFLLSSSPTAPFTISSAAVALAASAGIHHTHHAEINQPTAPAGDASWDEFPNGRFTDVRSPAYGELDGYGGGLKILVSPLVYASAEERALTKLRSRLS